MQFPVSKYRRQAAEMKNWNAEKLGRLYVVRIICANIATEADAMRIQSTEDYARAYLSLTSAEQKKLVNFFDIQKWLVETWATSFQELLTLRVNNEALKTLLNLFRYVLLDSSKTAAEKDKTLAENFNAVSVLIESSHASIRHIEAFKTAVVLTGERIKFPEVTKLFSKGAEEINECLNNSDDYLTDLNELIHAFQHLPFSGMRPGEVKTGSDFPIFLKLTKKLKPESKLSLSPSLAAKEKFSKDIKDLGYYRRHRPELQLEKSSMRIVTGSM